MCFWLIMVHWPSYSIWNHLIYKNLLDNLKWPHFLTFVSHYVQYFCLRFTLPALRVMVILRKYCGTEKLTCVATIAEFHSSLLKVLGFIPWLFRSFQYSVSILNIRLNFFVSCRCPPCTMRRLAVRCSISQPVSNALFGHEHTAYVQSTEKIISGRNDETHSLFISIT